MTETIHLRFTQTFSSFLSGIIRAFFIIQRGIFVFIDLNNVRHRVKTILHRGFNANHRGKILVLRGKFICHRGKNVSHRGEIIYHRGKNIFHWGGNILHRCEIIYHWGGNVIQRGESIYHWGKTICQRGESIIHQCKTALYLIKTKNRLKKNTIMSTRMLYNPVFKTNNQIIGMNDSDQIAFHFQCI